MGKKQENAASQTGSSNGKSKKKTQAPIDESENKTTGKKRGWDEIESLFDKQKKQKKQDAVQATTKKPNKVAASPKRIDKDWVDDGLGGKYNQEGYTGRFEGGVRVFKAHVLSKPNAGQTADCPFDCECCYI